MKTSLIRSACFFEAIGMAVTSAELEIVQDVRVDPDEEYVGVLNECRGHVGRPERVEELVKEMEERDRYQARKRRRAFRIAQFLSWIPGVRFVALANTTAFGNARDGGDLDFFLIVRHGMIWTVRLLSVLPLRLLRRTPREGFERDAVCLSYFISDKQCNIQSHQLPDDDPYFRYWFLSLVPLCDDGIGEEFWKANAWIYDRHPSATQWQTAPEFMARSHSWGWPFQTLEAVARKLQMKRFPRLIREQMNQGTAVMVSDETLKFHVEDGREQYRTIYRD